MFLAHKISLAKWDKILNLPVNLIPADAITTDLRTEGNTLSFWNCGDQQVTMAALEEVSLAILTEFNRAQKIYLFWLNKEALEACGYHIEQTDGKTKVPDLVSLHHDICDLDYELLGDMARRVQEALIAEHWRQLRREEVLKLAVDATMDKRLDIEDLKPQFRSEVEARLRIGSSEG